MGSLFSKTKTTNIEIKHRVDLKEEIIKPEPAKLSINSFPQNPSFEFIIDFGGNDTDIPDDIEIKESKESEEIDLKQAAQTFIFALSDYLHDQHQISFFDKSKIEENTKESVINYNFEGILCLGLIVEFSVLNRPHNLKIKIVPQFEMDNAVCITLGYGPKFKTSQAHNLLNKQGPPYHDIITNMKTRIHSYHLHCHFYKENGHSEALGLYNNLLDYFGKEKVRVIGKDIMYSANGPHTCWNWQIFVEDAKSLGYGLCFLCVNGQQDKGVFLPFHARCYDIEGNGDLDAYLDHTLRLGWIGTIDTHSNANMEPDKSPRLKQYYIERK